MNHDQFDNEREQIITEIVKKAAHRICFTENFFEMACSKWPELKFILQPQAVCLPPDQIVEKVDRLNIVLVTGIRPVKDVLFALECWKKFKMKFKDSKRSFLIVGPTIDQNYAEKVFKELECMKEYDVSYQSFIPQEALFKIISQSFATLNSSKSEGQSAAILESMSLGIPVIARNIPGNRFIKSGETGLLFDDPEDFSNNLRKLENGVLWETLSKQAKTYIKNEHSEKIENETYCQLADDLRNNN